MGGMSRKVGQAVSLARELRHSGVGPPRASPVLGKPPSLALLLPLPQGRAAQVIRGETLQILIEQGVEVEACAETSYFGSLCQLYVLRRRCDCCSPASQLLELSKLVAEATVDIRPTVGPWMWPVHDSDVGAALTVSFHLQHTGKFPWRWMRWLHILDPPGSLEEMRKIRDQYGPATSYVFAWVKLYTHGLWMLSVPVSVFSMLAMLHASVKYVTQASLIVWALIMCAVAGTQQIFLLDCNFRHRTMQLQSSALTSPLRAVVSRAKFGGLHGTIVTLRKNPEYMEHRCRWPWYVFSAVVTSLTIFLFMCFSFALMVTVLCFKIWLIYDWGECHKLNCAGPELKYGLTGVLASVGVDIMTALLLNVLTGEACKSAAYHLSKLWNFETMKSRQYMQALVSLLIDVIATVGMFVLLAFWFLPAWEMPAQEVLDPRVMCKGYNTYEMCRKISGCKDNHQFCCSGTVECARAVLPLQQREMVFHAWLTGLFIVVPFVDILVQVIIPSLTSCFRSHADDRCRCCCMCCRCCSPLARLLAVIFVLDIEVTGLSYIWNGRIFKKTKPCEPPIARRESREELNEPVPQDRGSQGEEDLLPPSSSDAVVILRLSKARHAEADAHMREAAGRFDLINASKDRSNSTFSVGQRSGGGGAGGPSLAERFENVDGPLDQVHLRPWDAVDELIPLKIRFLCIVLFAPLQPYGLIPNVFAAVLDMHLKLPKLLLLKRRNFPLELAVAHVTQNIFTGMVLPIGIVWHLGLVMVSQNKELYQANINVVLGSWLGASAVLSVLVLCFCRFLKRKLHKLIMGERGLEWRKNMMNAYVVTSPDPMHHAAEPGSPRSPRSYSP